MDPSASERLALDRRQAIERVRQFASRYGVETAGWRATVTEETVPKHRAYLRAYPDDPTATLFSSVRLHVALIEPGGAHRIRMVLFANGQPKEWKWDGAAQAKPGTAPDAVLTDFLGAKRESFHSTGETKLEDGALRSTWNWHAAERFQLSADLTVEQKAAVLRLVTLAPVYGDGFEEQFKASQKSTFGTVVKWTGISVWIAGFCLCFWQLVRGKLRWRIALMLLATQIVWAAFSFWGGTYYQELVARSESVPDSLIFIAGENSAVAWSFFWLFVFAAAGSAMRTPGNREKWLSIELISRGRVFNRTIGESLAVGMLGGLGLSMVPYLAGAIRWFPGVMDFRSMDALVAPSPLITALRLSAAVPAMALFGFLFPSARRIRKSLLFWALFIPLGVLVLADSTPYRTMAPALIAGILFFGGYLLIYLRSDLLAVMTAMIAARAVVVPGVLLSQTLSSYRDSALPLITIGLAAIAASVYWAVRGPEPDAEPALNSFSAESDAPAQSDRERLQAEFQVARKAQQDALPAAPPVLNGYSLAGWCEPAQQVGGDLYDYFPLPDGRLGIAVADVSGKGVPAALYMMVTKGLLSAASRDSNQLAYILEQTNLHLYRACRKKVFVTLAAVVLDPSNHRMQYGRAGHNPVVWRRARRGETTLVKPPGLGLGMTPGERFNRSLRIEELELEPEDAVVLYSDGVTEAVNHAMDQFGEERLMRSVESTDGRNAVESRDAILRDLADFMGTTPARDDITLVVIRA